MERSLTIFSGHKPTCFFFVWAIFLPLLGQSQDWREKANALQKKLVSAPTPVLYDSLHFLVTNHYLQLTAEDRSGIREVLKKNAHRSTGELCDEKEPGTKITIRGRLLDEYKKPIPTVQLYIFHADNNGYYAPSDPVLKKMNEADPRLYGFLTTDKSGNYSFQTVRPASYPNKYNGRTIPQHIHISVKATGYKPYSIQLAFENDPAMQEPYWQNWAKQLNYPVVSLYPVKDKGFQGVCDLVLSR